MSNKTAVIFAVILRVFTLSYCNIWEILVRVIGLENSLRVQTNANTRKYMQVNANKSDSYLHLFAWVCIYFAVVLRWSHHLEGSVFDVCVPGCPASTIVFERR